MSSPFFLGDFASQSRNRALGPSLRGLSTAARNNNPQRWSSQKTIKEEILLFYARQSEGIPHIPDYLTNTVYDRLVKKQYVLFNKKNDYKYEARKDLVEPTNVAHKNMPLNSLRQHSLDERSGMSFYEHTPTSSNNNAGKKVPTVQEYAALSALLNRNSYDFNLLIQDLRLPSAWDVRPKCDFIGVNSDNLELTYTGDGKDGTEVASVRANHAMKKQCGIYYFEIQVISKGIDGHIGIGFCRNINSLNRFPGWEEHSWGYHAENGKVYSGPGTEKSYGPSYGTGDIIGCGVDFRDMSAFYTINGIYLGIAFDDIYETDIYPFVGFKTAGEKIEANFGTKPFLYDIKQHRANEKRELLKDVTKQSIEPVVSRFPVINAFVESDHADKVVMEYLRHHGFLKSAAALEGEMKLKSDELPDVDTEMINRQGNIIYRLG
ncbi:concanavalin A-like lectin/glucanase domain-containing protein [Mucor mucedo]|uniref:concanavalin A-like lectin/glucanase domain-containing protein n=1 Tax=Mucor mucedo TaxID=29922 RepID=UPI0022208032|nr:concanavalin A-like lectin/glucanase domain-containing protein [Mucor mucedo]KAI7893566.1 concanavalin A-like lectin/glucanase domain-containing protein [Mucor mucedo]